MTNLTTTKNRIVDDAGVRAFFEELHANEVMHHPEDPSADCLSDAVAGGFLTDDQVAQIQERMDECFEAVTDPCDIALKVINAETE